MGQFLVNIGALLTTIGGLFAFLQQGMNLLKTGLDTTKVAQEVFHRSEEPLQKADVDDKSIERAHAAAELLRSFALFGFLEYLLWATRAVTMLAALWRLQASVDKLLYTNNRKEP